MLGCPLRTDRSFRGGPRVLCAELLGGGHNCWGGVSTRMGLAGMAGRLLCKGASISEGSCRRRPFGGVGSLGHKQVPGGLRSCRGWLAVELPEVLPARMHACTERSIFPPARRGRGECGLLQAHMNSGEGVSVMAITAAHACVGCVDSTLSYQAPSAVRHPILSGSVPGGVCAPCTEHTCVQLSMSWCSEGAWVAQQHELCARSCPQS